MDFKRNTAAVLALYASFGLVSTQSFPENVPLASCVEIDCPISDSSTTAQCRFDSRNYTGVGVSKAQFTDGDSPLAGITWTQALDIDDRSGGKRGFDKRFYMGTPEGLDLGDGLGGCALFFTNVSSSVKFGDNPRDSVGSCADALSERCVDALNKHAATVDLTRSMSSKDACAALRNEFLKIMDDECKEFSVGGEWHDISAEPLTGSNAPEPFTSSQNTSTNCWPTLPRSNHLSFVKSFNRTGDYGVGDLMDQFFTITPILTIFYPRNSSLISSVQTGLSCLNIPERNRATEATKTSGGDEGSGVILAPSMALLVAPLMAAVGAFVL